MKKILLAAISVLSLAFGTVALAAPADASRTFLSPPNQNEGGNN